MSIYKILLTFLLLTLPSTANALSINDMRIGNYPDKTRIVFDLDQIADFRVFTLDAPYRIVVDMPTLSWNSNAPTTNITSEVTAIRHGQLKPGISRIVIDANTPIKIRSAFALPATSGGKSNRLVIDFTKVDETTFQQYKKQSYGTLETGTIDRAMQTAAITPTPATRPFKKPIIIIDPGHGGNDPGAIGKDKIYEKDIVLKLSKAIKAELEATGLYTVHLTRSDNRYIRLSDRVKIARQKNADLFISIHADSIGKSSVKGASVYTLSEKASDAQTAKLAARENQSDIIAGIDLSDEDADVANILVDLARRDTMNQSKFFAGQIIDAYDHDHMRMLDNSHRHAGFAVLKAPDIPSILLEAGFMSNTAEARQLNTPSYRKQIAKTLRKGVDSYFEQIRKNQRI